MQLSPGKPLPFPRQSSIFRTRPIYLAGRSEREERGGGEMVGSFSIRDGGITVAFNILSNPGKHRILFPVSVAVLWPSHHGWPGSEPMIAQSFCLEQPACSLSLHSISLSVSCSPAGPSCPISPAYPSLPFAFPSPCPSQCHRLARRVDSVKVT